MILIKKTTKPSLGKAKIKSYLFAHEDYNWQLEQDPITDLWNIYLYHDDTRSFVDARSDFKQAKSFVALNAVYILPKYLA